ncbi:MAG: 4-hydroxy-tetrahydrodipicolinate synthase [Oscillibacter sp.]|nr:4-hydroxy-tetrahydrodipicolinate synthase [Oscillibacter sp.]
MKQPIFTGSGVAIISPFHNGQLNLHALKSLLDFQLESGTDAIIVCGTTGEASTMTYKERMQAISCCAEHVAGRVPVIAGSGSNSTEITLALSKDAISTGADAVLVVTPYYNKATQQGLIRHFSLVADAVTKPVILYNVPSRTGVTIAPETYAELAKHPNINGVKEASGNLSNIQKTRNFCGEDFSIWSGNDDETAAICLLGGVGVISVAANIVPTEIHALVQLCLENDYASAGLLQLYLKDLCDTLFCEVNPIPVKTAMNLMGMDAGDLRLPLCPPSETNLKRIHATLKQYALLSE